MDKKYKILMVEDQVQISELYKKVFEKFWFEFDSATDWLAALTKIAKGEDADVIVLDIMMPNMDGLEMLKILKTQTSNLSKIIIFSNLHDEKFKNVAKDFGAECFLIKAETTPRMLLNKITELLQISIPWLETNH